MKILKHFFFLVCISVGTGFEAQSVFPYEQQWGTYVGGTGTHLLDTHLTDTSFSSDTQNNLFLSGTTAFASGYSNTYYDQFTAGGGNPSVFPLQNRYSVSLSVTGQQLSAGYNGISNGASERLIGVDSFNNRFMLKQLPGNIPNLSTPGAWLTQNVGSGAYTYTLSKYDSTSNLVWTTYLPNSGGAAFALCFDEDNNVFVRGGARESIAGLGTAGVYQENFVPYQTVSGQLGENGYIVKLNSAGQKMWATYCPDGTREMEYYAGNLYTSGGYDPNMPGQLTTPGTFQPTGPAMNLLMKLDAATGQRIWSTFYGTPHNITTYTGAGIWDIEVNSTGLYVSGQNQDTDYPAYFATPGAFKGQLTGGADLFLTKFSHDGNRVWSTYFGSDGYEEVFGSTLTILGNRIIIAGSQYGAVSNISTPGAHLTTPSNTSNSLTNMFFAEFDSSGSRLWCSYFGGAGANMFQEHINPELLSDGTLILWGSTGATTGIGTEGAPYQSMTNPYPGSPFGFVTRFVFKDELGTSETAGFSADIQLYNNPNNGNFTLSGSALAKEATVLALYDTAGRLVKKEELSRQQKQDFSWGHLLTSGNYILSVSKKSGELLKTFKMTVKK
ncbi:T9SS type A sorting domain-containing protein [Marnyiella aurantia]|uniref:T9SS type A sorting domain-containing protein n=1 Tax=Marnyiella aurantia TaxID=2758037 RepID=A0A7D7LNF3_9FLAO|nr:T9SS type A sorting domain-containing protein [Marnyiella aurantia]MBA5247775.1 T9SS type A sorting domain-containing protein [Marnyiella aurantia]QMS97356.1 T9SS type A sorting domain-containing protein [Marnyiella aurantia]